MNDFSSSCFSCKSKIGKQGQEQIVYLAAGCEYKGTILHELRHVLGFYHEHNRADRDDYLTIYRENIDPSMSPSLEFFVTLAN